MKQKIGKGEKFLNYKIQLPKRKAAPERKIVRQLLRLLLQMEEEQRQIQEEQKLFHKPGQAH